MAARRLIAVSLMLGVAVTSQVACSPGGGSAPGLIQQSHIDGNVPAQADFDRILRRDLMKYFAEDSGAAPTALDYQLLRDGPTQSGVAYPKFYAWVVVQLGAENVREGAVRIAAIGRERFEVTDFLSRKEIAANPPAIRMVFPEPVCLRIEELMRR